MLKITGGPVPIGAPVLPGDGPLNFKKLIPLYMGAAIGPMGGFGVVTILPVMAKSWAVDFSTVGTAITFYMIPFIVIQIFSGAIAQIFDARRTLLTGFFLYTVGGVLSGFSPNLWIFLSFRIIQGIGAGFLTPIIMAMIGEIVPARQVGKAIGLLGVAYTIGVTMGPFLSGIIEVWLGWPWFFFFMALMAVAAGLAFYLNSSPTRRSPSRGAAALFEILPLLKRAIQEPGVILVAFAAFCLFLGYIGIMTFTADHLKTNLGLASDRVGSVLSITGLSGIIVSPIAGYLGDRLGRRVVFVSGTLIALTAIGLMVWMPYSFFGYLCLFLLLGVGAATAWTSLNTMAVEVSTTLRQPVTSLYNAIKFSGYAVSPMILALLYAPFDLRAVQMASMGAIGLAAVLASMAHLQIEPITPEQNPTGEAR